MPFTGIYIGLTHDSDTFTPTLEATATRVGHLAQAYEGVYAAFRKMEERRFDAEGPGWRKLASSTVARRGSAHPILNETGVLRRSLTTKGARYAVVEPTPDGLFMGTSYKVARFHQDGTHGAGRDHSVSMPARPVVDITQADAEVFGAILSEWFWGYGTRATAGHAESFAPVGSAL
jgi:phage gpG-like protein